MSLLGIEAIANNCKYLRWLAGRPLRPRFKWRIEIQEGEDVSKWYGLAWREWNRDVYVGYVIPLNLIMRGLYNLYLVLRAPRRKDRLQQLIEACRQALQAGEEKGYVDGWNDAKKIMDKGREG